MRTLPLFIALVMLGCATPSTQSAPAPAAPPVEEAPPEPTFSRISAPEGFSIEFPGSPKDKRGEVATPKGTLKTAAWVSSVEGVLYNVSTVDYPAESAKPPEAMLAQGKAGIVNELKAQVLSDEPISLAGVTGRDCLLDSAKGTVKVRLFAAGNRLYTVLAVYSPNLGAPPAMDRFFSSFELTAPPAPPSPPAQGAEGAAGAADGSDSTAGEAPASDAPASETPASPPAGESKPTP